MTLLSRIFGLIRDVVFARFFGAGMVMDAFFVAFKIPNFMRRLFGEGAFSQAFVPVISEYKTTRNHDEVRELAEATAGTLGLLLLVITVIGVLAAPVLIIVFAPGWFIDAPEKYSLAAAMLRLTFPYLLFISLTALAGGILNTYGRFGAPAFTPVLLNLVLIAFAMKIAPGADNPGVALAAGVFVAGVVQLVFQVPFLWRIGFRPRFRWGVAHDGVRKIGRLMLPALFGSSVAQINLLLDTLIASFLMTGSISWLYYSDRLMEFPLGVFGIALATVILPGLSKSHARQAPDEFSATLDWALKLVCLIAVPAAVGLLVLARPMLTTIFQYGLFDAHQVHMAGYSLMAYAFGLLGFTLIKVLVPGYFSRQDTKTPVRFGLIALAVNFVLNVIFVSTMILNEFEAPHTGLALATSLAAFLHASLLYFGLRRDRVYQPGAGWGGLIVKVIVACAAMAISIHYIAGPLEPWLAAEWPVRAGRLLSCVLVGGMVYFAALAAMGVRPGDFRSGLRGKSDGPSV
jgi:putative peptidoglycan lipid II flippase